MKTKLTIILIFLFVAGARAQNGDLKHFEVTASVNFWAPTSLHLKTLNSVTQYSYPNGTYLTEGTLSGFGTSLAPGFHVSYFFNENTGISLGLNMVNMDNELSVKKTDSTYSNYENIAQIANITLGISGRYLNSENLHLFYEVGINIIPNYDLEMQYSDESSDPPDMNSIGKALGVYCKTGIKIRIAGSFYFNSALSYSFVPVELEYTNGEGSEKINEKTNLGGISLQTGLSFDF